MKVTNAIHNASYLQIVFTGPSTRRQRRGVLFQLKRADERQSFFRFVRRGILEPILRAPVHWLGGPEAKDSKMIHSLRKSVGFTMKAGSLDRIRPISIAAAPTKQARLELRSSSVAPTSLIPESFRHASSNVESEYPIQLGRKTSQLACQ